jgi:hypothetical protein
MIAVLLCGMGYYLLVKEANESAVHNCRSQCRAEDEIAIQPPIGTSSSGINDRRNPTDNSLECICIIRPTQKAN